MKIWHISDTHTFHGLLQVPENVDMIIFSGDCSNPREPIVNRNEVLDFIEWMKSLDIKHKIFVAGNHDTSIERNYVKKQDFVDAGITYLENDWIEIDENNGWASLANSGEIGSTIVPPKRIKVFGSPQTPSFGNGWAFNKKREKMHEHWKHIPDDIDIIVTHGPPKNILDLSYDRDNNLECCGDSALRKRIIEIKPKLVCFGHIHNNEDIVNAGTMKLSNYDTVFSNGSVVTDGKFGKLSSNGNIFKL